MENNCAVVYAKGDPRAIGFTTPERASEIVGTLAKATGVEYTFQVIDESQAEEIRQGFAEFDSEMSVRLRQKLESDFRLWSLNSGNF